MTHYIIFTDKSGGNPYITMNNAAFWRMLLKFEVIQTAENVFEVTGRRKTTGAGYFVRKSILEDFAKDWQNSFSGFSYSWLDLTFWGAFFEEYGAKYGLIKDFRANAIC